MHLIIPLITALHLRMSIGKNDFFILIIKLFLHFYDHLVVYLCKKDILIYAFILDEYLIQSHGTN